MKKEVKVRAHDRADGSHVRQHSRTVESANTDYMEELPPEGLEEPNYSGKQPAASGPKSEKSSGRKDSKEG